jgi:hypothetical protein
MNAKCQHAWLACARCGMMKRLDHLQVHEAIQASPARHPSQRYVSHLSRAFAQPGDALLAPPGLSTVELLNP